MRWLPLALVAIVPMSGCIIHNDNPIKTEEPADIIFYWTFATRTCSQSPEVLQVHITLDGPGGAQKLEADGYYKCSPAGVDGITLKNFAAGSYTFRIDGLDAGNAVAYTTTGTLRVSGPNATRVTVDLASVKNDGRMQLFWRFLDGANAVQPCATTGIADGTPVSIVRVYINNENPQDLQCTQNDASGKPVQGWAWTRAPGSYQVTVDGLIVRGGQEQLWYSATQTVTVIANQSKDVSFDLLPVAAGARFKPVLVGASGGTFASCAAAGVKAFHIVMDDYNDPPNSTTPFWSAECDNVLANGFFWDYLPAFETYDIASGRWKGTWTVQIEAWDRAEATHTIVGQKTVPAILWAGYKDQTVSIEIVR